MLARLHLIENRRNISNKSEHKLFFSFTHDATDLEAIEVCVEDLSTLDVSDQSHGQLLIGLISNVHHGGDVYW